MIAPEAVGMGIIPDGRGIEGMGMGKIDGFEVTEGPGVEDGAIEFRINGFASLD